MKQLYRFFFLCTKRWLKSIPFVIFLVCLPFLMLLFHTISIKSEPDTALVFLFCEKPDALTDAIFSDLQNRNGQVRFQIASDRAQAKLAVARGDAVCSYIFPDDFSQHISEGNTDSSILLYHASSALYPLTREYVFSAILHRTSETIAAQFFSDNTRYEDNLNELLACLPDFYHQQHTADTSRITLDIQTLSQTRPVPARLAKSYAIPIRGLCACLLFSMALFGSASCLQDYARGLYRPMPRSLRLASVPVSVLSLLFPCALSVQLSIWLCSDHTPGVSGIAVELLSMIAYLLLLTAFASLLAHLLRRAERLFALMPLLCAASLILCPVFVNPGQYFPSLTWLEALFPPSYYLACAGSQKNAFTVTLFAAAALAAADYLPNRKQNA